MAHELEIIQGNASFFSVREVPWHHLGTVVPDDVTSIEDMLTLANLNWEATLEPVTVGSKVVPSRWGVTRNTDGDVLGIVGNRWRPIQPRQSAEWAQGVVDVYDQGVDLTDFGTETSEHVRFETGGMLRPRLNSTLGARLFFTLQLPRHIVLDPQGAADRVATYLLVSNGFDGFSGFTAAVTNVRVVCANTEAAALAGTRRKFTVQHSESAAGRMQEAREALGISFTYGQKFQAQAEALIEQTYTDVQFDQLVKGLFPKMKADALGQRQEALRYLFNESPTNEAIRGTKWAAYNAVTEWADWASPARGTDEAVAWRRAMRNTTGRFEDIKLVAWGTLTQDPKQRLTVAAS